MMKLNKLDSKVRLTKKASRVCFNAVMRQLKDIKMEAAGSIYRYAERGASRSDTA